MADGGALDAPGMTPGAADGGEMMAQTETIYYAGGQRPTDQGGTLPCAWIDERTQEDGGLLLGVNSSGRIVGASIVRRGDRCELSAETTARVLVTTALGGLLSPREDRAVLWGQIAGVDVRDIASAIRSAGSLEAALIDNTRLTAINASLTRIDQALAAMAGTRRLGVTADPHGFDELEFGTPVAVESNRVIQLNVTANEANEVKALVVGDTVQYIKGDSVIDLYGFVYPDERAMASATLRFPVGMSTRGIVRVLAPSAITGPFQNPSTTLREELIYNNVLGRTLTAHMLHALTGFIPELTEVLQRDVGCAREILTIAQPLVMTAVESVLAGRSIASAARELVISFFQAVTEETLRFTAACRTDAATQRVVGRFLVIARAVEYLGSGLQNVWDAATGPYLAQHTVDFCAACGAPGGAIPVCSTRANALVCTPGGCDPSQVGTPCSAGVGECLQRGTMECVGGAPRCDARPGAARTEVCGNDRDEDCNGGDLPCPRPCAGDTTLGTPCNAGAGACRRTGTYVCDAPTSMVSCTAVAGSPSAEQCNGVDDDCDGAVDETLTRDCYTGSAGTQGVGTCRGGSQSCAGGAWGTCAGQVTPRSEVCGNGADEDCNGAPDNGCVTCGDNFCTRGGFSSGAHCNGDTLVQCDSRGGCVEVLAEMSCPAGCRSDRCAACASNACQSRGSTSGSFCSGSDQIECGSSGGCPIVQRQTTCPEGCDAATGRCIECTTNYCQSRGYRSGSYCEGNDEITCGVYGGCGVVSFQRDCGSVGCSGSRCNACPTNWCQTAGQSSGSWCDGSAVVACTMDGPCRREASRTVCPGGCTGGRCGMTTSRVFQQSYDDRSLFNDRTSGNQRFTDGEQFSDACGTSAVQFGSSYRGASALNFYCRCRGTPTNTTLSFPSPARADETLRLQFWAYNPFTSSVQVQAQRAGGSRTPLMVPPQEWTQLSADLRSALSTSDVILFVGDLPDSSGGFTFRIDEVTIDRF